jgi:hypothetical protein
MRCPVTHDLSMWEVVTHRGTVSACRPGVTRWIYPCRAGGTIPVGDGSDAGGRRAGAALAAAAHAAHGNRSAMPRGGAGRPTVSIPGAQRCSWRDSSSCEAAGGWQLRSSRRQRTKSASAFADGQGLGGAWGNGLPLLTFIAAGQRQGIPMLPALPSIVGLPANGGAHPAAFVNPSSPAPGGALPPAVPNAGPAVSIVLGLSLLPPLSSPDLLWIDDTRLHRRTMPWVGTVQLNWVLAVCR